MSSTTSSMSAQPAGSRSGSEEGRYALLEWYADPETSLQRRVHAKLAGLSGKNRRAALERYLESQRYEIAADNLRRWLGQVAVPEEEREEQRRVDLAAYAAEAHAGFLQEMAVLAGPGAEARKRLMEAVKAVRKKRAEERAGRGRRRSAACPKRAEELMRREELAALAEADKCRARYVTEPMTEKGVFLEGDKGEEKECLEDACNFCFEF